MTNSRSLTSCSRHFRRLISVLFALALFPLAGFSCGGDDRVEPLKGQNGHERWVVFFDGDKPDLKEFRQAKVAKDAAKLALVQEELRTQMAEKHKDFSRQVRSFDGKVVAVWVMANAMTVSLPPGMEDTIKSIPGVKKMEPDTPLQ